MTIAPEPKRCFPDVEIEAIPAGKALAGMLADGELDALFSARPPSCFQQRPPSPALQMAQGSQTVARLFPDYRAAEQAYYRKAGVYPLMHAGRTRRRHLALRSGGEPQGDRHAVPLPARTGVHKAADGRRRVIRARDSAVSCVGFRLRNPSIAACI